MVTIRLHGLAVGGEAVGRTAEDLAVFVPYGAPGELIEVELVDRRKNFARAKLLRVIEPSDDRTAPPCPHFGDCGGCLLQHITYPAEVREKTRMVRDALERIGRVPRERVLETIAAPDPWSYRNKAGFVLAVDARDVAAGFHARGSHRVVNVSTCAIQSDPANRILAVSRELAQRGLLDGVERIDVRANTGRTEVIVTLVGRLSERQAQPMAARLREEVPAVTGVLQRPPGDDDSPAPASVTSLTGNPYLHERIAGYEWRAHGASFFQVNPTQAGRLLDTVLRLGAGADRVIDAYCGVGFFSLPFALAGAAVVGIEGSPLAVTDAEWNVRAAGESRGRSLAARFIRSSVERGLASLLCEGYRADLLVLDPPRTGAREAVPGIVALAPARIVYVSCDPATLARDLRAFSEAGYDTREVQPIDMFPRTAHVECVALVVPRSLHPGS